jgi:hypothetical protein
MLDIYGHLIPSMQEEAALMIDKLITPVELHSTTPNLHPIFTDEASNTHI